MIREPVPRRQVQVHSKPTVNRLGLWQRGSSNRRAQRMPSTSQLEADISKARAFEIAATREEVIDAVFKFAKAKNLTRLGRKALEAGYDLAEASPRYGNPNTVWAMTNGLTELSQKTGYADDRVEMDKQAGKVMDMAF